LIVCEVTREGACSAENPKQMTLGERRRRARQAANELLPIRTLTRSAQKP
jgi:hypothetical protein